MKAKDLIDVGTITPDLLNPHLRRKVFGEGGTTLNEVSNEPDNLPIYICRVVSTANILLDGSITAVDSVTLAEGDTVLVSGQTNEIENGIYFAFSTGWVRYTDIKPAMLITISEGTVNADTVWMLTSNNFVIGTDDIIFEKVLPVVTLPAGTNNNILRHNGTDWIVANKVSLEDDGTNRTFKFLDNSNAEKLLISSGVEPKVVIQNGANSYIDFVGGLSNPIIRLQTSTLKFKIGSGSLPITLVKNNVGVFNISDAGVITSNALTANTYLGANASKQIVSIPNPNTIKYNTALIQDTLGVWTPVPTLTFSLEANVTYELELYLSLGNNAGRNGSIQIFTSSAAYTHRPFIIGNSNGANPAVIYINDSTATQPFNLDNSTELQVQNADSGSVVMLKGIITSAVNIPNAIIQIKTRDVGSAFQCKQYSYLKLTR